MQYLSRIIARVASWVAKLRDPRRKSVPLLFDFASYASSIHREVTANGVRVFSLCVGCGIRLNASATLCEECAQKRSRPTRPI